jgi:hypothetical protein
METGIAMYLTKSRCYVVRIWCYFVTAAVVTNFIRKPYRPRLTHVSPKASCMEGHETSIADLITKYPLESAGSSRQQWSGRIPTENRRS